MKPVAMEPSSNVLERLFVGDGEMCALMRSHDWAQTPLGPVEQWPQSLRTTLSILLSTGHPMVLFWGPDLVQFYNDGYRPSLGAHKHPQALGQRGEECWTEIWYIIGPQIQGVMTQGKETWYEDQLVPFDRNGYFEEIYFTYSYSPVRDESGEVGGTLVVCTETTQQVLSNRRLQTLRDLDANVMNAKTIEEACKIATDTMSVNPHDIPFALLYLIEPNGQHAKLMGATGIEIGTDASPVNVNVTQRDGWELGKVCQTGQAMLVEDLATRFSTLPGGVWNTPPLSALVIPLAKPASHALAQPEQKYQPTGLLVMGISPRLAFDDKYQGFFNLVATSVTTAIANAYSYEAERQRAEALAEIDRAKTLFFSNISHEFRTPLTLMLAPAEDALADTNHPLSPIQRSRVEIIQRNGLRLLKLVNTLLDFSRIEAGRIQAVYEPTDLAAFVAELASTFRSLIERADLSLMVDCPPLPEAIYIDREMWEKIVFNLLSNAFKFTFTGKIIVQLKPSVDHVELIIQDTGIGIPPNEIPRLFERFHRVKGAQGRSFEGSGIGLSLVQELVKLHGGHITVTSELGKGSCFTVSVPTGFAHLPSDRLKTDGIKASRTLVSTAMGATPYIEEAWGWLPKEDEPVSNATSEQREHSDESEYSLEPASLGNTGTFSLTQTAAQTVTQTATQTATQTTLPHILVVDDNADMRDYAKRLLEQLYSVDTVEDGISALNAIHQRIPDLVLTDVMMPRLDGFGLLRELRSHPQTRELPIILLSARAGEESRIEGLEAGADDYLIKPFSTRELLARVEATLKMAQIRREAAMREQALRLTAEEARQEAEAISERLTQILESMSDGFIALDKDWRIIYMNSAGEQINCNKPCATLLGNLFWDEWKATIGSNIEYQYRYAMAEHVPVHFEHHYYDPPEYDLWLEIHAYPYKEGLGIFFHDVTEKQAALRERQQAEDALKRAKEELEIRVEERTAELRQIITELQQAEECIKSSLREKEVLLKEVHHRVKNNLGIVSSLLQMQVRRTQDPEANTVLRDSQNRIASIALVHEKLYRSDDLANINFTQYIRDLIVYLFDSYNISSNRITLDVQVETVSLDAEIAIPCGLIINELVSNALKHAFPGDRKGKIQIRFSQVPVSREESHPYRLTLTVQDNGIGLPDNFDTKRTKTLGLSLVYGLSKQIGGTIEIHSNSLQGTEFNLTFIRNNL